MPNNCHFPGPPPFSLPNTFKNVTIPSTYISIWLVIERWTFGFTIFLEGLLAICPLMCRLIAITSAPLRSCKIKTCSVAQIDSDHVRSLQVKKRSKHVRYCSAHWCWSLPPLQVMHDNGQTKKSKMACYQCCGSRSVCLGPPGSESGSVSHKYRSGSGIFHHQVKIVRKTSISYVCDFLMSFYLWRIIYMYQRSGSGSVCFLASRLRIRIC